MKNINIIAVILFFLTTCVEEQPTATKTAPEPEEREPRSARLFVALDMDKYDATKAEEYYRKYKSLPIREKIRFISIYPIRGYQLKYAPKNVFAYYEISEPSDNQPARAGYLYQVSYKNRVEYNDAEGEWYDLYVSDTTEHYGYFYVQIVREQHKYSMKNMNFEKIRIRASEHPKSKRIEGFYKALLLDDYRYLTEEDVKRSRAKH